MKNLFLLTVVFCGAFALKSNAKLSRTLSDVGRWGNPIYALGLSTAEKDNEGTIQLFISAIGAQIASETLKKITKEKRPDYTDGAPRNSFPSGHAVGAFSGAMFIHKRYGLQYAVVPYLFAAYTGFERVDSKRHHLHDVLAGAAVSALFTWGFVSKYNDKFTFAVDEDSVRLQYKTKL